MTDVTELLGFALHLILLTDMDRAKVLEVLSGDLFLDPDLIDKFRPRPIGEDPYWRTLSQEDQETLFELESDCVRDCIKDIAIQNLDSYDEDGIRSMLDENDGEGGPRSDVSEE